MSDTDRVRIEGNTFTSVPYVTRSELSALITTTAQMNTQTITELIEVRRRHRHLRALVYVMGWIQAVAGAIIVALVVTR